MEIIVVITQSGSWSWSGSGSPLPRQTAEEPWPGHELVTCINTGRKECYRIIILVLSPMCSIMFHNKVEGVSYCCDVHLSRHLAELLLTTSLRVRWPVARVAAREGRRRAIVK